MWKSVFKPTAIIKDINNILNIYEILLNLQSDKFELLQSEYTPNDIIRNDALNIFYVNMVFKCSEYRPENCEKYAQFLFDLYISTKNYISTVKIPGYLLYFVYHPSNLKNCHCLILLYCMKFGIFERLDFCIAYHSFFTTDYRLPKQWFPLLVWFGPIIEEHNKELFNDSIRQYVNIFNRTFEKNSLKQKAKQFEMLQNTYKWSYVIDENLLGKTPDLMLSILKNNDIDSLTNLYRQKKFDINSRIEPSILEINFFINNSPTLIQVAAFYNSIDCFQFLVNKRAKLSLCDDQGISLIEYAAAGGSIDIVNYLLGIGFSINGSLHFAAMFHQHNMFDVIYKNFPDLLFSVIRPYGTVLHQCAISENIKTLFFALEKGININSRNEVQFCIFIMFFHIIHGIFV